MHRCIYCSEEFDSIDKLKEHIPKCEMNVFNHKR